MNYSTVYLCAGGTGGHLFPALAVARELKRKQPSLGIAIISDKEVNEPGMDSIRLRIPRRSNTKQLPLFVLALIYSFFKCLYVFWKKKPELVVGFGGYPSVPAVLAAQTLKIPTLLHEQNAYLGRANRYLLKRAQLVATSFAKTIHVTQKIPHMVTGNPVRIHPCSLYPSNRQNLNILVIGGSQGAAVFSTLLPEALSLMSAEERAQMVIIQQCRIELHGETEKAYKDLGMTPVLAPFFDRMQDLYEQADLIIARCGASTVSEVTVAGRAVLFVPYPHAMDNHQLYNAKALGDACFLVEQKNLTSEKLSDLLRNCLQSMSILEEKAKAVAHYSMANASEALAQVIQDLLPPR